MVLSMDRWHGKVAVVTGGGSGIGAAVVKALLTEQLQVVAVDNRSQALEELSKNLQHEKLTTYTLDVTKEEDVTKFYKSITEKFGPVHILINSAGIMHKGTFIESKTEAWKKVLNVNVTGLCHMTIEAVKIMKENKIDGHIIQVCSISGHGVGHPGLNIYPPSKFAIRALAETFRLEFNQLGLKIKITNISPGAVNTSFAVNNDLKYNFDEHPSVEPSDIADGMVYALSTPPHVQVHELMIRPVGETF